MRHKLIIKVLFVLLLTHSIPGMSQTNKPFSGEHDSYSVELQEFMGVNLNIEQTAILRSFISAWDSTSIAMEHKQLIISASISLHAKRMRPSPHFIDFLNTLMSFIDYDIEKQLLGTWLDGLNKLVADPKTRISDLTIFIQSANWLISENILFKSNSVQWMISRNDFSFENDSVFRIIIPTSFLICYAQRDSTIIYETAGAYNPVSKQWSGDGGVVTWEKAGYPRDEMYAELGKYSMNMSKSSFDIDSVKLSSSRYFEQSVYGKLSDRSIRITSVEKASFPRFETYQKTFNLKNIYEDVDFKGGLTFEGANVKGTGTQYKPAEIRMYRNDTLYVKAKASDFLFTENSIKTQSAAFALFLDEDSIYHSDIAFSFNVAMRELNTFRSRFPTSRSPYYSSYHMMDMYIEYLSWKMDESKIKLSHPRGASMGQAYFESSSFYSEDMFFKLLGIDDNHPLYRLSSFAEWYYNTTFPVSEFAKWLARPEEMVIGMCIDLANRGFVFFNRATNEITIKKKVYDYINSYAKKIDYDVVSIYSQTNAPLDNAVLDMRNYKMTINGVPNIFLSDSQNVAIFPYGGQIVLEQNRAFEFDGVVQAGMITVFGNDFKFNYDTFKINLPKVDSIMLSVETGERDEQGRALAKQVEDLIQMTKAELLIDHPNNKSGLASLEQYPIFYAYSESYVYYNRIPGLEGVYPQADYYFRLDPFTFENTDRLQSKHLDLKGTFYAGNILEPMDQTLSLQNDKSLGFYYSIPEEGLDVYGSKGKLYNSITMSNAGLKGQGRLNYLTLSAESEDLSFFPDSMTTRTTKLTISSNTVYPEVISDETDLVWYPDNDEFFIETAGDKDFSMFDNGTSLSGKLLMTPGGLSGSGEINLIDSRLLANNYSFTSSSIQADSADYNLKSVSGDGFAFIAEDANTMIDFDNQISRFRLNTDSSVVKFPEVSYICTMTDFEYNMEDKILSMFQKGKEETTLMPADELLKQDLNKLEEATFFSTNKINDTISFSARSGKYLLEEEKIIVDNVNYIPIADALIQPENGNLKINKGAKLDDIQNAIIAINNNHIIHSANIDIVTSIRYTASGLYDYIDENNEIQNIKFDDIVVDSLRTKGNGHIPKYENFLLSPDFTFQGDVSFRAGKKQLNFLGSSGIVHDCDYIGSAPMKFTTDIDPNNVMIPITDKPRDINGNLITAGTYVSRDSTHVYSAFLSPAKSWSDTPIVLAQGWIYFDKEESKYKIGEKEKLANTSLSGSLITFDRNYCEVYSEGPAELGLDYGLFNISSAAQLRHDTDSNKVLINTIIALDFFFSEPALTIMANEIRFIPTLKPVDLSTERFTKGMQDLLGDELAATLKEEMDLFGISRSLPEGFEPELVLNDLTLEWNQEFQSYRSTGPIGIGFIGRQALNVYVDGFVEFQKRRSGDMLDVYLKVDDSTWYWFSYTRGVLMTLSGNNSFNSILREEKTKDRQHPNHSISRPYTYMIGLQDRFQNFIRRITITNDNGVEEDPIDY